MRIFLTFCALLAGCEVDNPTGLPMIPGVLVPGPEPGAEGAADSEDAIADAEEAPEGGTDGDGGRELPDAIEALEDAGLVKPPVPDVGEPDAAPDLRVLDLGRRGRFDPEPLPVILDGETQVWVTVADAQTGHPVYGARVLVSAIDLGGRDVPLNCVPFPGPAEACAAVVTTPEVETNPEGDAYVDILAPDGTGLPGVEYPTRFILRVILADARPGEARDSQLMEVMPL